MKNYYNKTGMKLIVIYFIVCLLPASVLSQNPGLVNPADSVLPVIKCSDFKVTGDGSSKEWNEASWITLGRQRSASPYQTRFKILYSDSGVYCLFYCQDNRITSTLKGDNLDIYLEDVVEAFFWTDETVPVYFEYELSPMNYELVLMVPNYNGNFLGWIPWHYAGNRLTRHATTVQYDENSKKSVLSWMAEFYIPFELLKPMVQTPPQTGTRWRANFYRIDYDNGQSAWSWLPVPGTFHDYRRFGTILFK